MSSAIATRGSLVVSEELKEQAASTMETLGDERIQRLKVVTSTGRELVLDHSVAELVFSVLERVSQGGVVGVHTAPEILTTSAAADVLGVSRTTVMKLIRSGELPSEMAGSHHRVRHSDALKVKRVRDVARDAAIDELLDLEDA